MKVESGYQEKLFAQSNAIIPAVLYPGTLAPRAMAASVSGEEQGTMERTTLQRTRVAVCGSDGSIMNHATAQMNHKLAYQAAFHQHAIGAPRSSPLLKRCPEFTRERCEGFQRATLLQRNARRTVGGLARERLAQNRHGCVLALPRAAADVGHQEVRQPLRCVRVLAPYCGQR